MKQFTARDPKNCNNCHKTIQKGEKYWANSYSSFCESCGDLKNDGELTYDYRNKRYKLSSEKLQCDYCEKASIGVFKGKAYCEEHAGKAHGVLLD